MYRPAQSRVRDRGKHRVQPIARPQQNQRQFDRKNSRCGNAKKIFKIRQTAFTRGKAELLSEVKKTFAFPKNKITFAHELEKPVRYIIII